MCAIMILFDHLSLSCLLVVYRVYVPSTKILVISLCCNKQFVIYCNVRLTFAATDEECVMIVYYLRIPYCMLLVGVIEWQQC